MRNILNELFQVIGLIATVGVITFACVGFVHAAEQTDCIYQRIKTAYAWQAYDDAQHNRFNASVMTLLASDLDVQKNKEHQLCGR